MDDSFPGPKTRAALQRGIPLFKNGLRFDAELERAGQGTATNELRGIRYRGGAIEAPYPYSEGIPAGMSEDQYSDYCLWYLDNHIPSSIAAGVMREWETYSIVNQARGNGLLLGVSFGKPESASADEKDWWTAMRQHTQAALRAFSQ